MANVTTLAKGGTSGSAAYDAPLKVQKLEMDIAKLVAAGLLTTEYAVALNIPANSVLYVWAVRNATALSMGSSPAISVGDSSSATLFVNAASTLTADTNHTVATASKTYSTANTLRLTLTGGTLASGSIEIVYSLIPLGRNPQMTT